MNPPAERQRVSSLDGRPSIIGWFWCPMCWRNALLTTWLNCASET